MKKSKILISAVTMFSLCITPMSVYAQVDPNSNIENTISQTKSAENLPTPVLQEKEIEVSNGTGYSLNNIQGAETVKALEQGTIVISYKATGENAIQSLFSVGNGTNGNQNRHFHIYVTNSGGVGMELRNTDGDFKYTLDRPAAVRGSYKGERVSNTIAFKADKENKKYKLFADGELIATLDKEAFKFISDITGVDNIMLGGTLRQGQVAYPFEGTINSVGVYQDVISDDELVQLTGQTTYADNINKRPKSSPYVSWKCFACGTKIRVHYKHARCRDLYCDKCRPIIVKKNGILLRYMLMFKNHVRALILKHTNIEKVLR